MATIDLSDYDTGETLRIELESGETFGPAHIVGDEHDQAEDRHDRSWTKLTLEGEWWDQVSDRVDSEVLYLNQESDRGGKTLESPTLSGTVWVGETPESSTPEYTTLGTVASIDRIEGDGDE